LVPPGLSPVAYAAEEPDCPNDCGPNGQCITDTRACEPDNCKTQCKCDPGWGGADCDSQLDQCPNSQSLTHSPNEATFCFNGGICKEVPVDVSEDPDGVGMVCDCSTAVVDNYAYVGHQCEHEAQVSCESGRQFSSYAFCVNGGTCKRLVEPGDPHPLCNCPDGFEGRHCQFDAGTAPKQEQILTPTEGFDQNQSKSLANFLIVVVSLIAFVFMAFLGIRCVRRRRAGRECGNSHTKPSVEGISSDLDLDASDKLDEKEIL
jgi:hypothetical protein